MRELPIKTIYETQKVKMISILLKILIFVEYLVRKYAFYITKKLNI